MSHLRHRTSLCITHISKVTQNQRVICLILIYNVPRTGQSSLLQMLPRITCHQTVPSYSHTHDSQSDLEHWHSLFLGASGHQNQLTFLFNRKSAMCNLAVENYFFSIKMQRWIIQLFWINFSGPNIKKKKKNETRMRGRGRKRQNKILYFPVKWIGFQ